MVESSSDAPQVAEEWSSVSLGAQLLAHVHASAWLGYQKALKRCRRGATPTGVHALRVAIRRYLAAVDLLRAAGVARSTGRLRKALRDQLKLIGRLRDVHVHLGLLEPLTAELPEMQPLNESVAAEEAKLSRKVVRRLDAVDAAELERWFKAIHSHAPWPSMKKTWDSRIREAIDGRFQQVLALRETVDSADTETIHHMRQAFRDFRYATEAFSQDLTGANKEWMEGMSAFQAKMGAIQDVETLLVSLRASMESEETPDSDEAQPLASAVGKLEAVRQQAIDEFMKSIDDVYQFWKEHPAVTAMEFAVEEEQPRMELYILRHAEALARGTVGIATDRERPLTPKGQRMMAKVAKGLRSMKISFDLIITSPYERAKQSADIIAHGLKLSPEAVIVADALSPDGDPRLTLEELQQRHADTGRVLIVGHEPYLTSLVSILVTGDLGLSLALKKGGMCKLTLTSPADLRSASLRWVLTPKLLVAAA